MNSKTETKVRNDCRKVHVNGQLWQFKWGKTFMAIYSPDNKRHNVTVEDVYVASLGREVYEKRLKDTDEWRYYAWDWPSITTSDLDLEILERDAEHVREYIKKELLK
jgi:hypothetical protein